MSVGELATKPIFVVRQLTASDLGWFAGARARGAAAGRQRAIQMNSRIVREVLTDDELSAGGTDALTARGSRPHQVEERPLRRNEKNWRFMGAKVDDPDLSDVADGDWIIMALWRSGNPSRLHIRWDVVCRATGLERHRGISDLLRNALIDNMALIAPGSKVGRSLASSVPGFEELVPPEPELTYVDQRTSRHAPARVSEPVLPAPVSRSRKRGDVAVRAGKERRPVREHLQQPHILVEMMKHGMSLSARAQQDFLGRIEELATSFRNLLVEAGLLKKIILNQGDAWDAVRGQRFAFVDGGVANIEALGSEPLAIRVGSYSVTPGVAESDRGEEFEHVRVLVDELFEVATGDGLYDDFFDDPAKLRDAARWCLEMGAVLELLARDAPPKFVFLHGPLVSPVSPYALEGFPNFALAKLPAMLPNEQAGRQGRDANFIAVYLEQLRRARDSGVPLVGVVERASGTRIASAYTLKALQDGGFMAPQDRVLIEEQLKLYRITDPMLFECVLEEGEYLAPLPIDKNRTPDGHDKIPNQWRDLIEAYPVPLVTYVKPSGSALPIRVEMFVPGNSMSIAERVIDVTIHMSRLLPRYAFPAGLDIVDKFAKVPAWMSLQLSKAMAAQVLRKALETGNPQVIGMARRFLSGNVREWLFRPKP